MLTALLTLLLSFTLAQAEAPAAKLSPDAPVDQVLDALHARGQNLEALTADVKFIESDDLGDEVTRTGKVMLQNPAGDTRFRASLDRRQTETRIYPERIDYVLQGGVLVERNHPKKIEVKRQILKPGERMNLLRLGEGPFPLPIGQTKEDVHAQFEVEKVAPNADDPEAAKGMIHLRLKPKADTRLARKFSVVDVWVDPADQFPKVISTLDGRETTQRRTELSNVQLNPRLGDDAFRLEPVKADEWQIRDEGYED